MKIHYESVVLLLVSITGLGSASNHNQVVPHKNQSSNNQLNNSQPSNHQVAPHQNQSSNNQLNNSQALNHANSLQVPKKLLKKQARVNQPRPPARNTATALGSEDLKTSNNIPSGEIVLKLFEGPQASPLQDISLIQPVQSSQATQPARSSQPLPVQSVNSKQPSQNAPPRPTQSVNSKRSPQNPPASNMISKQRSKNHVQSPPKTFPQKQAAVLNHAQ